LPLKDNRVFGQTLSKDKITNTHEAENYVVSSDDYFLLKGMMLSNTKTDYKGNEFGSFKITVKNIKGEDLYDNLDRQKSIELLNKLIKTLENENTNKELLSRLEKCREKNHVLVKRSIGQLRSFAKIQLKFTVK